MFTLSAFWPNVAQMSTVSMTASRLWLLPFRVGNWPRLLSMRGLMWIKNCHRTVKAQSCIPCAWYFSFFLLFSLNFIHIFVVRWHEYAFREFNSGFHFIYVDFIQFDLFLFVWSSICVIFYCTYLMICCLKGGDVGVAKYLIEKGASLSLRNNAGNTPLSVAVQVGFFAL